MDLKFCDINMNKKATTKCHLLQISSYSIFIRINILILGFFVGRLCEKLEILQSLI